MQRKRRSIILLLLFCISIEIYGQVDVFEKRIELSFSNTSIGEAIAEIGKRADISFSYSSRSIPVDQKINIPPGSYSLRQAMDLLFMENGIEYMWLEQKMILRKAKEAGDQQKRLYTISGYLTDEADGETLIGATVLVTKLGTGTISNAYGFYSITLPQGSYTLSYSYLGYDTENTEISLYSNVSLDVDMKPNSSLLEEVIVTPNDSIFRAENIHNNITQLSNTTILEKPSVLGEPDVIKSLDILPGIQLFNDGSTFFNVRGGDRDQNQILVDEAPIYNPAHMLGLYSSFVPESIKDIKIYKGNASANFGGRISSVMDIHTNDGNFKELKINGRVGLVTSRISFDGPIKKDHSSFFISGRRSHIKAFLGEEDFDEFYFSDLNAKVNLKLNTNNRLFLSVFSSNDEYLKNEGLTWKNIAGTIRWNHTFNDRLFLNTTLYSSKYEYNMILSPTRIWANHIANASLKTDFTFFKNPQTTLKFGFKLSGHNFNPGNMKVDDGNVSPFVPKRNATEFSLYYSNEKQLSSKWLLTYGARLSTWTNYGRTIEYTINDDYQVVDTTTYETRTKYNEYSNLEPRIKLTHILDEHNFLNFNYARSAQYINLISNSISPFNNLEVWLPASVNIEPQTSDQLSLGWVSDHQHWQIGIEGYFKKMQNQIDYSNQAELLLNPHFEAEIRSGEGTAYGFETVFTKKTGRLTGSIAYVFSRSFRKITGINNDNSYSALSDRPIQLSVNAVLKKSERTKFSGSLIVSSGAPVTTPTSFYQYSGRTVPIYNSKNNDRLPTYHRLDLAWTHRLNKMERKFMHYISVSVFNFYGRKNSVLRSFNKIALENGDFIVPTEINNEDRLKATHTFVYQVVPSITYSFTL